MTGPAPRWWAPSRAPAHLRGVGTGTWVVTLAGAALWVGLLQLHGFWFGRSQPALMTLQGAGVIQCMHDMGLSSLWSTCSSLGVPVGLPLLTGLPQIGLGWLVSYVPGVVDAWAAHQVSHALVLAGSLASTYGLMRRWAAPRWVALLTGASYLASPSVLAMNGFAYTYDGFVLLPTYLLGALVVIDLVHRGRWVRGVCLALPLALVAAFTDGYSLFAATLMIGAVTIARSTDRAVPPFRRLGAVGVLGASLAIAVGAYVAYTPSTVTEIPVGMGGFRYLGLDVATLVLPQPMTWWAALAGAESLAGRLWGDGSNVIANYVGVLTPALAVTYLTLRRRRPGGERRVVLALGIAAAVALVLALGPALKVYSLAQPVEPGWDVPTSMTTVGLPTTWVYEHVPGFEAMRATYRWFLLTRFVLVVLAGLGLSAIWARARESSRPAVLRSVALGAAALLVVETAPNIPDALETTDRYDAHVRALREGVIADGIELVRPGERVLMLPTVNDFLAPGLIPFTGASAFNAAPDKNYLYAMPSWPDPVLEAREAWYSNELRADAVCRVLERDADAVLLPVVDPMYDVMAWPPVEARTANYRWIADQLAADPRFVAERRHWLTVLRPSGSPC
ncbi:hypothetical protein [Cellulosimicrobium cellulans]|uniref:hypothetical protein n=1 Tax=Cellulosimicrobium cellulans TaxID=1710 RepID=UPI00130D7628|nr:hypothetical protein [Cellulosimicrobium cellulans]